MNELLQHQFFNRFLQIKIGLPVQITLQFFFFQPHPHPLMFFLKLSFYVLLNILESCLKLYTVTALISTINAYRYSP